MCLSGRSPRGTLRVRAVGSPNLAVWGGGKGPLYLRKRYLTLVRDATERIKRDNPTRQGAYPEDTFRLIL